MDAESTTLLNEPTKKSPIKYYYLHVEEQEQARRNRNIFWLECFAMFVFIYASTCSKLTTGVDLHFFVGVMIAIPICAKQTGANLNPGVSFSMTFKGSGGPFTYSHLLWIYIKAQIIGAILAMGVAVYFNEVYREPVYPQEIEGYIKMDIGLGLIARVMLSEAIGMFILIFLILSGTGPYSFITNNGAKYVYIAIFVYIGRKFACLSGNQINVALTISQAFVGMVDCNFQGFKWIVVWIVGDIIGVTLASLVYLQLVQPTLDYLQRHETAKAMSKLNKIAMREIREENKIQLMEMEKREGLKDYYKKLQYF